MEKDKEIRRSRRLQYRIHILPEEMMARIFEYLSYKELKAVVSVCKQWRMIGKSPRLWWNFPLTVSKANQFQIPSILKYSRLSLLKEITIETPSEICGFVRREIFQHVTVEHINILVSPTPAWANEND